MNVHLGITLMSCSIPLMSCKITHKLILYNFKAAHITPLRIYIAETGSGSLHRDTCEQCFTVVKILTLYSFQV